ncbi:MAG: phage holin family protein [Chitinophagaceae bacterium]|nr:MAG: phage holin family protein [Chitinophagaceae bacterium]
MQVLNFIVTLLLAAIAIIITSYILPGVHVNSFLDAIIVAAVLSILNAVVKPILIILTIPITIFTLGLFLLVINALVIMLAAWIVPDFNVVNFWWALLFSLILSLIVSVFNNLTGKGSNRGERMQEF